MILKSTLNIIFRFYYDGFRKSSLAKKLLIIVCIKLFILFFILKIFFFKDFLNSRFENDQQKGNYVIEKLTGKN